MTATRQSDKAVPTGRGAPAGEELGVASQRSGVGAPRSRQEGRRPDRPRRRPRRSGQWAAAVFFVVIMALAAGWLWVHRSDQVEVLAVRHDIPAGSVLQRSDLSSERVSGVNGSVAVGEVDQVVGKTTRTGLVAGQLLNARLLTSQPLPAPGDRLVAVQGDATRVPQRIELGDRVEVLSAPTAGGDGAVTSSDQADGSAAGGQSGSDATGTAQTLTSRAVVLGVAHVSGGTTRLTLQVPESDADAVAIAAATNRVVVLVAPLGGDG